MCSNWWDKCYIQLSILSNIQESWYIYYKRIIELYYQEILLSINFYWNHEILLVSCCVYLYKINMCCVFQNNREKAWEPEFLPDDMYQKILIVIL